MHTLTFQQRHRYADSTSGIGLPVVLSVGTRQVSLIAKVDSGAAYCIFQRAYADVLGLQLEGGHPMTVATANGTFQTYGHGVRLSVLGMDFDVMVWFAADEAIRRNVLGRHGWLDHVRVAIVDYDTDLFVSRYDD